MEMPIPRVSVVIPTRYRAELVCRAVRSALAQTLQNIEVIVVIDGPDNDTVAALKTIEDHRVRVTALNINVGGAEARNLGVQAARGKWVAFLDDDDEWYTEKLEKQLILAETLPGTRVIVTCQYFDDKGTSRLLRPRRYPRPDQPISDFLYSDVSLLGTIEGFPQTSTWFVTREFMLEVPFRKGLKRNQDTDWVLQAFQVEGIQSRIVPEPLSIFHNEIKRKRITQNLDWKDSYSWAMSNRRLFTPKALSCFLAIMCMNHAAKSGVDLHVFRSLLADCRKHGAVTPKVVWLMSLYGLLYPKLRRFFSPERRQTLLYHASSAGKHTA